MPGCSLHTFFMFFAFFSLLSHINIILSGTSNILYENIAKYYFLPGLIVSIYAFDPRHVPGAQLTENHTLAHGATEFVQR